MTSRTGCGRNCLLKKLFVFLLIQVLDRLLPFRHFYKHFLLCRHFTHHPCIPNEVSHCQTHVRLVLEHTAEEIFELFAVETFRLCCFVSLPEFVHFVLSNQPVERVFRTRFLRERWCFTIHYEENHSDSEQVHISSLVVALLLEQLWSHVSWCSNIAIHKARAISAFKLKRKTEIDEFYIEALIKQYVFRF